jgi:hypothetical protein
MSNTSETTRCPCRSDEQLRISKKGKEAWILCKDCNVWQQPICVGLLEDGSSIPKDYFCEECKPQQHGRFEFGPSLDDPDNRVDIAKQRHKMHMMKQTDRIPEFREKMMWLIDELMAIVERHSASIAASWTPVSGLSEDLRKEDSFDRMLILSIRIVLRNAEISPLQAFRAKLNKVRFSEGHVVAEQVWTLREWLTPQFMTRMENVDTKETLEMLDEGYETQGLEGMGKANTALVKKYFNL